MNATPGPAQASANAIKLLCRWLAVMTRAGPLAQAAAPSTGFTYQGRLFIGDVPANGLYDLQFTNYDAAAGGNALGGFNTNALPVTNGLFVVSLDFGAVFDGTPRWLEISERTNGVGAFGMLVPRQLLAAVPYATYAASAGAVAGLTIVQNSSGAPNVIGGSPVNWVAGGVVGATIGGGGAANYNGYASTNSISANFGTIGGGWINSIQPNADDATISGGVWNTIRTNAFDSTIGGGFSNTIQTNANDATIGGGVGNLIESRATQTTIGGGNGNAILTDSELSTIGGGYANVIQTNAIAATVGGGYGNKIQPNAAEAVIGGGYLNTVQPNAQYATIGGGETNMIELYTLGGSIGGGIGNTLQSNAYSATVSGGYMNTISRNALYASIGGGEMNTIQNDTQDATIAGGVENLIQPDTDAATIGGGEDNWVQPNAIEATIGGGVRNTIQNNASVSTICGGSDNTVQFSAQFATIGGGSDNTIVGGRADWMDIQGATIGGGSANTNYGWYATIPGGVYNTATNYAFAAGNQAKAVHTGAFVWADSTAADFSSTANNEFAVRAAGGVRFVTGNPGLTVFGPVTAMAFNTSSDRNLKEHLGAVKPREVLDRVASLPIWRWNFKADEGTPHIGPTAQDFYAAFSVGSDDRHIATVDADGVALAAIQGLNQKLEETRAENADLRARLEKLERLVQSPK